MEVKCSRNRAGSPAEFMRDKILDLIRNLDAIDSGAILANFLPLIERTFRYSYRIASDWISRSHPASQLNGSQSFSRVRFRLAHAHVRRSARE